MDTKRNAEVLFLQGKFDYKNSELFEKVPSVYAIRDGLYLQRSALRAFIDMAADAKKAGIFIYIISATRNFHAQKYIWEKKFSGERKVERKNLKTSIPNEQERSLKILEYSSMPGTSRHHWGTDIDLAFSKNDLSLENSYYQKAHGLKGFLWLKKNASRYGFCQPYQGSVQIRSHFNYGYHEEKWHWSYKPLSASYLLWYKEWLKLLKPSGFLGAQSVAALYGDYVFNIHIDCL